MSAIGVFLVEFRELTYQFLEKYFKFSINVNIGILKVVATNIVTTHYLHFFHTNVETELWEQGCL